MGIGRTIRSGYGESGRAATLRVRRGFTLAELMVAVAVLLILMTMVGWIFATATRASGTATSYNEVMGLSRTMESQLAGDLGRMLTSRVHGGLVGIWYQLTPNPEPDPTLRWPAMLRTDRMVFYTNGNESIRQLRAPTDPSTWGAGPQPLVPPNTAPAGPNAYKPISAETYSRVFLGQSYAMDPINGPKQNKDPHTWALARRARVVSTELNTAGVRNALNGVVKAADADKFEFETTSPETCNAAWQWAYPLQTLLGANGSGGWMTEAQGTPYWEFDPPSTEVWCCGWMRRPVIDPADAVNGGTHMLFVPGCAEFKIQRWIERNPWTGQPLGPGSPSGMPRWWPEEDADGDGVANSPTNTSDFQSSLSPLNIREYYNGPRPSAGGASPPTPHYPDPMTASSWLWFGEDDFPKAIKVTVRVFDANKRIADGQVLTMTFGVGGDQY